MKPELPDNSMPTKGKRNLPVFAFFVLLSFIFWYLNSLSKNIEAEIRYPVKFVNARKINTAGIDFPEKLNMVFEGPGYTLLRYKLTGRNAPLEIDIAKNLRKSKMPSPGNNYIITEPLLQNLNSQLKSECKILAVKPDTLFLGGEEI